MKIQTVLGIFVALMMTLTGCRSRNEVTFSMDPVDNVEALWQIIDTKYCYVEQKNVDWNTVHDTYRTKAETLPKNDQVALFDLGAEMLNLLEDGHVNL